MINNVKVRAVCPLSASTDSYYKCAFGSLSAQNLLLVMVLPLALPDSVLLSTTADAVQSLE